MRTSVEIRAWRRGFQRYLFSDSEHNNLHTYLPGENSLPRCGGLCLFFGLDVWTCFVVFSSHSLSPPFFPLSIKRLHTVVVAVTQIRGHTASGSLPQPRYGSCLSFLSRERFIQSPFFPPGLLIARVESRLHPRHAFSSSAAADYFVPFCFCPKQQTLLTRTTV